MAFIRVLTLGDFYIECFAFNDDGAISIECSEWGQVP